MAAGDNRLVQGIQMGTLATMEPDGARLIDLATRGLEDNLELRLAAEAELRQALETHALGREMALAEAADSLERAEKYSRSGWWRFALLAVMLAVSLPLLAMTAREFKALVSSVKEISNMKPHRAETHSLELYMIIRTLSSGAVGAGKSDAEKWRSLWESESKNPAFLAEYALASSWEHETVSAEILEAAERIDSDNGWFRALAASWAAVGAVFRNSSTISASGPRPSPVWEINDRARLDAALAAIHEIAGQPRFTAYREEIEGERVALLPPLRDSASQIQRVDYVLMQDSETPRLRILTDMISAGAQVAAAENDEAGFRRIVADWRAMAEKMIGMCGSMVDCLVTKIWIVGPLGNFRDAALSFGMTEEAAAFSALKDRTDKENESLRKGSPEQDEMEARFHNRGSYLAAQWLPMTARRLPIPPPLTDADLRPGRYSDHALVARAMTWAGWGILGICAGAAGLSRFVRNRLARRLADRMWRLLRPVDWAWIIGGGVVLPLVWYFLAIRLTPLSSWEWSVDATNFVGPGAQFGFTVLAMIFLPVSIASSRLAKRGAALGLMPRFPWMLWASCGLAFVAVAACGALSGYLAVRKSPEINHNVMMTLASMAVVWLLAGAGLSVMGNGAQALRRAALAKVAWPAWIAGMLALAALDPLFYAEESRYIRQDRLLEISSQSPRSLLYDAKVIAVLRRNLEGMRKEVAGEGG